MTPFNRQPFGFERQARIGILTLSPEVERMTEHQIDTASAVALDAIRRDCVAVLVIDLSRVSRVGSFLLGTLFRFYKRVREQVGTEGPIAGAPVPDRFVLVGPSAKVRELLELTCLHTLWPLYNTRGEAITALSTPSEGEPGP